MALEQNALIADKLTLVAMREIGLTEMESITGQTETIIKGIFQTDSGIDKGIFDREKQG